MTPTKPSKTCLVVCRSEFPSQGGVNLHFEAAPGGGPENTGFFANTPAAAMLLFYASKQATADFFEPNTEYLVKFTKK
jgi:hypothetical protein